MTKASAVLDRVLVLEMVRVTEAAAIAASTLIGRGDEKAADAAAVEAMRGALNELAMDGTVVIGEGERDEAPMLYIGEKVGSAQGTGPKIDIALDPLEGTTICATAGPNSLAVLAIAEDERIRGDSIFQRWLLRGPSRLAFWRTISSGRVKVRLRLRDGLLTRLNIRHRHQDWA